MKDLRELADKYGSDKGFKHNYTVYYGELFEPFFDKNINILEIGFGKGASIKMWLEYFPFANVYCIDNGDFSNSDIDSKRFVKFSGDQSEKKDLNKFTRMVGKDTKFDIIIDDGSHRSEDGIFTLNHFFKHLNSNGLYVIEDMNCRRKKTLKFGKEEKSIVDIIKEFFKTSKFRANILSTRSNNMIGNNISDIKLYNDKICFIRKR